MSEGSPDNSGRQQGNDDESTLGSFLGHGRRRIDWARDTAERDAAAMATIPAGPWSVYGFVGAVVVVFSVFRLGIADLYIESIVFLGLAIVIGLLGWSVGMAFVIIHSGFDLLLSIGALTPRTFLGRIVSYIVLYALVVSIPSTQRSLHARLTRVDNQYPWLDRVAAPASAVIVGFLVYIWAEVAHYLVRSAVASRPPVTGVTTIQNSGVLLALLAVGFALVIAVGYQRRVGMPLAGRGTGQGLVIPTQFTWIRGVVRYGVVFVLVSGLLSSIIDVVLLAVALVAADLLLPYAANRRVVQQTLLSIPYTFRLVLAFAITFAAAQFFMSLPYRPVVGSQFLPLVAGLAVGIFTFRLILNVDEEIESTDTEADGRRRATP